MGASQSSDDRTDRFLELQTHSNPQFRRIIKSTHINLDDCHFHKSQSISHYLTNLLTFVQSQIKNYQLTIIPSPKSYHLQFEDQPNLVILYKCNQRPPYVIYGANQKNYCIYFLNMFIFGQDIHYWDGIDKRSHYSLDTNSQESICFYQLVSVQKCRSEITDGINSLSNGFFPHVNVTNISHIYFHLDPYVHYFINHSHKLQNLVLDYWTTEENVVIDFDLIRESNENTNISSSINSNNDTPVKIYKLDVAIPLDIDDLIVKVDGYQLNCVFAQYPDSYHTVAICRNPFDQQFYIHDYNYRGIYYYDIKFLLLSAYYQKSTYDDTINEKFNPLVHNTKLQEMEPSYETDASYFPPPPRPPEIINEVAAVSYIQDIHPSDLITGNVVDSLSHPSAFPPPPPPPPYIHTDNTYLPSFQTPLPGYTSNNIVDSLFHPSSFPPPPDSTNYYPNTININTNIDNSTLYLPNTDIQSNNTQLTLNNNCNDIINGTNNKGDNHENRYNQDTNHFARFTDTLGDINSFLLCLLNVYKGFQFASPKLNELSKKHQIGGDIPYPSTGLPNKLDMIISLVSNIEEKISIENVKRSEYYLIDSGSKFSKYGSSTNLLIYHNKDNINITKIKDFLYTGKNNLFLNGIVLHDKINDEYSYKYINKTTNKWEYYNENMEPIIVDDIGDTVDSDQSTVLFLFYIQDKEDV